jgi:nucleoside 2-deoxyribosyltransferase
MKIYLSHAKKIDFVNDLYCPIKNSGLMKKHQFIFPHESNQAIDSQKLFRNKECDLMLAEVSVPATGQGIELGYAKILEIPIVCIYKKGSEIASSLKWITNKIIEYENRDDLIIKLAKALNE